MRSGSALTSEEIRRLREVAQITERSIDAALAQARPGATELDMARAFHHQSIRVRHRKMLWLWRFGDDV